MDMDLCTNLADGVKAKARKRFSKKKREGRVLLDSLRTPVKYISNTPSNMTEKRMKRKIGILDEEDISIGEIFEGGGKRSCRLMHGENGVAVVEIEKMKLLGERCHLYPCNPFLRVI
ncbi:hypothetical protein ACH5RR_012342 [Cinchona calisaya]|uniref:Uncharacterized protein n=1 Tax=Cinchona calisaya TaxID=153742 RepID=A0ABD3AAU2_9GENT